MGSLILCHKKRAKQPYMITRVHIRIYTIEELCYYICNNLYLIDYTLMNRQLCEWIREELHMWELADQLLGQMEKNCTAEQFVLTILESKRCGACKTQSGQSACKQRVCACGSCLSINCQK